MDDHVCFLIMKVWWEYNDSLCGVLIQKKQRAHYFLTSLFSHLSSISYSQQLWTTSFDLSARAVSSSLWSRRLTFRWDASINRHFITKSSIKHGRDSTKCSCRRFLHYHTNYDIYSFLIFKMSFYFSFLHPLSLPALLLLFPPFIPFFLLFSLISAFPSIVPLLLW